jgi:transcriptional regulator with XRE-family HTH domain
MIKQNEIAKELGISNSYLSMLLSGQRNLTHSLADKLEKYRMQLSVKFRHKLSLAKEEVAGPNPVFRSILFNPCKHIRKDSLFVFLNFFLKIRT